MEETFNANIHAKYEEDPSNHLKYHLELWLEARAIDGPNRNRVYSIFMTIA